MKVVRKFMAGREKKEGSSEKRGGELLLTFDTS